VVIVEYLDYNCPYCKKFAPALEGLLAEDRGVRVIYKDWPILGEVSRYAAQAALAARWQDKYLQAQKALMAGPRYSATGDVDAVLRQAGIDMQRLEADRRQHAREIDALLARNDDETRALGVRGTPGIIVGRQLLPGITDLSGLKILVQRSRRERAAS